MILIATSLTIFLWKVLLNFLLCTSYFVQNYKAVGPTRVAVPVAVGQFSATSLNFSHNFLAAAGQSGKNNDSNVSQIKAPPMGYGCVYPLTAQNMKTASYALLAAVK